MAFTRAPAQVVSDYEELAGSPTITADERGVVGVRRFKVRGRSLRDFVRYAKGSPRAEDPPESMPNFPSLMVVSVTAKPFPGVTADPADVSGGSIVVAKQMSSQWWEVECRYEVLTTIRYDFASEALTLPTGNLGWSSDNTPIEGMSIATTVPVAEIEIVRKALPTLPVDKFMRCLGKVNNDTFSPLDIDRVWRSAMGLGNSRVLTSRELQNPEHPPETVLFVGASATMVLDPYDDPTWDVTMKFVARPPYATWNKFFKPQRAEPGASDSGRWEELYYKVPNQSGGLTEIPFVPYQQTNMMQLFS